MSSSQLTIDNFISDYIQMYNIQKQHKEKWRKNQHYFIHLNYNKVAWPSGLRRWFKAPVFSEAWVQIPPLPR